MLDASALRAAVARHGRIARIVISEVRGSSPREVGASMLVWRDGQSGTIGGGALEFEAVRAARQQSAQRRLSVHALGPALGQCCGGSVTLLTELWNAEHVDGLSGNMFARPVEEGTSRPDAVQRLLAEAPEQVQSQAPQMIEGWLVEPFVCRRRPLWIWGAGHVGRALVDVLAPIPEFAITWIDFATERFPESVPDPVSALPAAQPALLACRAPGNAEHLVLTHSHALDLELCHQLLTHDFVFAGLIGSATKWARFQSRLLSLGHARDSIQRITCPIGDPSLGKHPQAIAVGTASQLLRHDSISVHRSGGRETIT